MAKQDDTNYRQLTTVGLEIAAGAGLGAAIGYWVDRRWQCGPWGVLIGTCLGIAAGMYLLIKEALKTNKD